MPFISLAIRPSKPSIKAAITMAMIAIPYLSSSANFIELNPIHTPTKVRMFGKITLVLVFETILKFFFGCSMNLLFC